MDLSEAATNKPEKDPDMQSLHELNRCFIDCPKIMIAAVNGPAAGWGTSTLGFFDLAYTVADAFFFTPFVQLGLCAEACCSFTLLHAIGRLKASRLILLGDRLSAQDLESAGLITQILPKTTFYEDVMKIAERLCTLPSKTLIANKSLLIEQLKLGLYKANDAECKMFGHLLQQDEHLEQKGSFLQQRIARKSRTNKL